MGLPKVCNKLIDPFFFRVLVRRYVAGFADSLDSHRAALQVLLLWPQTCDPGLSAMHLSACTPHPQFTDREREVRVGEKAPKQRKYKRTACLPRLPLASSLPPLVSVILLWFPFPVYNFLGEKSKPSNTSRGKLGNSIVNSIRYLSSKSVSLSEY